MVNINSAAVKPASFELWLLNNDNKQVTFLRHTSKMNINLGVCLFFKILPLSLKFSLPSSEQRNKNNLSQTTSIHVLVVSKNVKKTDIFIQVHSALKPVGLLNCIM